MVSSLPCLVDPNVISRRRARWGRFMAPARRSFLRRLLSVVGSICGRSSSSASRLVWLSGRGAWVPIRVCSRSVRFLSSALSRRSLVLERWLEVCHSTLAPFSRKNAVGLSRPLMSPAPPLPLLLPLLMRLAVLTPAALIVSSEAPLFSCVRLPPWSCPLRKSQPCPWPLLRPPGLLWRRGAAEESLLRMYSFTSPSWMRSK
mmetsp:Transcript_28320/g.90227  ORF Transcript_28320/g.90227 Transcript_28320/m.90227 type:complete len:202 (-) Transcript_28320:585-1190(-)